MRRKLTEKKGVTLVELLVAMVVMTILSSMIVGTWIALQGSYAYTVQSSQARSTARDVMSRMRRELRDALIDPVTNEGPIVLAAYNHIQIMTPFNDPADTVEPVDYWYKATSAKTGEITRKRGTGPEVVVATGIVNVGNGTPLFQYTYLDASGNPQTVTSVGGADVPRILTIQIRILADVNPGHSPTYMDLTSTVQPRNQRQF